MKPTPAGRSALPAPSSPSAAPSPRAQALLGEAVLRHVGGLRVLDLGHGVPEIAHWIRRVCAALTVISLPELDPSDDGLRIPAPDATFDAVVSLRTLPYLGHDEASSLATLRSLLAEAVRVTTPGGVLLLEINNPRSLRGFASGLRRPFRVAQGSVVLIDEHGPTRYDTLGNLLRLAPHQLELACIYGIPISRVLALPVFDRLLAAGEWWARDSFLRHFGAHLLVVLRKPARDAGLIAHESSAGSLARPLLPSTSESGSLHRRRG